MGVNGRRAAIIDLATTNPEGWNEDVRPAFAGAKDAIVYEMHHRDMTIHATSGVENKGKFLAWTEHGTTTTEGLATGIDHLVELGVTHVQILPSYDYGSVDETRLSDNTYNWGYDPVNYNAPDGGYSTNPFDPASRIHEMKQMIQALHKAGIRVIMDVVYNHTFNVENSNFTQTCPDYFYRHHENGELGNASGCGNETASERAMMRKYIIESCRYWIEEYHMDGFRFDLMGIHDVETMNQVRAMMDSIDPSLLLYGEGWAAANPLYDESKLAFKRYTYQMPGVGAFSDDIRDGLRGKLDLSAGGFIHGVAGNKEAVKFGLVGGVQHPQVAHTEAWCAAPTQHISYISCHDDHNIRDRLEHISPKASEKELLQMVKLAQFGVFTSQGIPFFFCGEEMFRSKLGEKNTYNKPDKYNAIDWNLKHKYNGLVEYYKGLIALRKAHPAFSLGTADAVRNHLSFIENGNDAAIGFVLDKLEGIDSAKRIVVLMNGSREAVKFNIPAGKYKWITDGSEWNVNGMGMLNTKGEIEVPAITGIILAEF